eukprot:714349-Ditylum_brightwellii.AAC.1
MVPKGYWSKESADEALKAVFRDKSVKLKAEEQFLVEAKYEKMDVDGVVNNQQHLKDKKNNVKGFTGEVRRPLPRENRGMAWGTHQIKIEKRRCGTFSR